MKKKLAVLLCMLLLVSLLVIPAAAENAAAWDGSVDTSWYNTEATEFEISTAAQLAGLSAITNGKADGIEKDNFFGKTIKLMADLDLGGVKAADGTWSGQMWYPIGKGFNRAFAGTFQGNGHKISNLYIDGSKDDEWNTDLGLFGNIDEDGMVKSVSVVSGQITSTHQDSPDVAGIAGTNKGVIFGCHNGADITAPQFAAGIAADNHGTIAQCSNSGTITRTAVDRDYAGGICACTRGRYVINCYNTGSIVLTSGKYSTATGGVVGAIATNEVTYKPTVMNCYSTGQITWPRGEGEQTPGGVCGSYNKKETVVSNCYFLQTETLNQGVKVGEGVTAMSAAQLQAAAPALSEAFTADTAGVNGGYPLLNWEKTGVYDQAENEGLAITALQLENGTITARLNKALTYFQPKTTHFTVQATVQPDGGTAAAQELKLLSCTMALAEDGSASIVTLKFEPLALLTVGQHVSATVKILDSAAMTAELEIPVSGRWEDHQADAYAGGDGSAKNPYQIATAKQLARLAYQVNRAGETYEGKYFIQTANIDLAGTDLRSDGMEWIPIGSRIGRTYKTFCGNYNGQNYTISNLTATAINGGAGLFGATGQTGTGGEIPAQLINIKLENVTVNQDATASYHNVGGLVGIATATDIRNCHVLSGSLTGFNSVGGLVGHFVGGDSTDPYTISGCSSTATVTGRTAGGLVGQFGCGAATGAVSTTKGHVELYDSFSAGEVKTPEGALRSGGVGGLIGSGTQNNIGRVERCYTLANVTVLPCETGVGQSYAGGLIGDPGLGKGAIIPKDLRIENNVVLTASLSGLTASTGYHYGRVGGLATMEPGELAATFQNNYVISTMTLDGQAYTGTSGDDANGTTKTPAELAAQAT